MNIESGVNEEDLRKRRIKRELRMVVETLVGTSEDI